MCGLLEGTASIAKRVKKHITPSSVMPPSVLAALITCCAEGWDTIEHVRSEGERN